MFKVACATGLKCLYSLVYNFQENACQFIFSVTNM